MENSQRIMNLSVLAGVTLLKSGAEIFRVQDTMQRILDAFEVHNYNVYVISNGIFATINENQPDHYSVVRHVPLGSVNLEKIDEINQISREICARKYTLEEAEAKMERSSRIAAPNKWLMIVASGFGAAGFCYLFGGSFFDEFFTKLLTSRLATFAAIMPKYGVAFRVRDKSSL